MTKFDPELVQVMRAVLEEITQRVPVEYSTQATKAYLAECLLKAAAQGQTSFDALMTAAANQLQGCLVPARTPSSVRGSLALGCCVRGRGCRG
jgi:hypothetical protein